MPYANGRLPSTVLRTVDGAPMLTTTANAFKTLILLGDVLGIRVKLADGLGSAYRDIGLQQLFVQASRGDEAAAEKVGLSTSSTVTVAAAGYSSHGDGRKLDIIFNNSDHPDAVQLALANHCGFTRQFGASDPDHFEHDGRTAVSGPNTADWNRIVAHYLNGRHLGQTTATEKDGIVDRDRFQHYTWELQAAGIKDGIYHSPPLKHDGIFGPVTTRTEKHYRDVLWASVG